jgi:hypothetical protein
LKDYWAFVADLKLRYGNEAWVLERHLAEQWVKYLARPDKELLTKSPSVVVAEFVSKARGLVASKEEVS